ncbi:MAG: prepilin-type cleavage/methylation domain-containing protein [Pseudomonadota bacterium]
MKNDIHSPLNQSGVILLESLIAILIFSIGILALVGLQAVMVSNTTEARFRSEASLIVQKRIAEIWANPANAAAMTEGDPTDPLTTPGFDISNQLPSGVRYTVQMTPGEFMVMVTWQPPGDPSNPVIHQHMAIARITGGA